MHQGHIKYANIHNVGHYIIVQISAHPQYNEDLLLRYYEMICIEEFHNPSSNQLFQDIDL